MKEMTGSGIFAANGENEESESGSANPASNNRTGLRMYQVSMNSLQIWKMKLCTDLHYARLLEDHVLTFIFWWFEMPASNRWN